MFFTRAISTGPKTHGSKVDKYGTVSYEYEWLSSKHEVYVMTQDGTLYELLEKTGTLLWYTHDIIEQPLLVDDLIYVSLQIDTLSAMLLSTVATRCSFSY